MRAAIDMNLLQRDVLDKGLGSALPSALSDKMLDAVVSDLEDLFDEGFEGEMDMYLAGPLALLLKILNDQGKSDAEGHMKLSEEEIFDCLNHYRIECGLEQINRRTHIAVEPATLETIFDPKREIAVIDKLKAFKN